MKRIWIAAAAVAALVTVSAPAMANDYRYRHDPVARILDGVVGLYFGSSHVAPKYHHRHGPRHGAHHHPPGHYKHHKARRHHGQHHAAIPQHRRPHQRRHGGARCYTRGHYTWCDETYNRGHDRGHDRGGHDGGRRRHSR